MPDREQLGLPGMPRRLFVCTPTRLRTWLDCPRRYRFAYLDRPTPPKGPPWAHQSFGASVHNALRAWWQLPLRARAPAAAKALVDASWVADGYRDVDQEAACRRSAADMVDRYLRGLDPTVEPAGLERTVAVRTDRLAVSGRVDRIDERRRPGGRELVVVDYKTGRQPLTEDDARSSLALAIYALATRATLHAACTRVELHHLPTGTVAGWDHTEASLARHLDRADAIGAAARAADERYLEVGQPGQAGQQVDEVLFAPRPGARCDWCDFLQHCPAGRAVAARRPTWAGIDDPVPRAP
jgi:RecB family exonuclease